MARIAGLTPLATTNGLVSGALAMVLGGGTGEVALYGLTLHWPELEDGGGGGGGVNGGVLSLFI